MLKRTVLMWCITIVVSTTVLHAQTTYTAPARVDTRKTNAADGGNAPVNPWTPTTQKKIANFGEVDPLNLSVDTMLLGGKDPNDITMLKGQCQSYSEGDEGGTCYQFDNTSGPQGWYRNGAGAQDGINVGMITSDNGPISMAGGNAITVDASDNVTSLGNQTTVATAASAGDTTLTLTGPVSCGNEDYKQFCTITSASAIFKDASGNTTTSTTFKLKNGSYSRYDPTTNTTKVYLATPLSSNVAAQTAVTWLVHSSDGVAYGIVVYRDYVQIYPKLSDAMKNTIRYRMESYLNIANGMVSHEHSSPNTTTGYSQPGGTDVPNYYYGFRNGMWDANNHTLVQLEDTHYPGTAPHMNSMRLMDSEQSVPQGDTSTYIFTVETTTTLTAGTTDVVINQVIPSYLAHTIISVSGTSVPDGTTATTYKDATHGWVHLVFSKAPTTDIPLGTQLTLTGAAADGTTNFRPGNMVGDTLDYKLTYTGVDGKTYTNTNAHNYPAPAIFFGMNGKNFNSYAAQTYNRTPDAITRDFANEWDFWTNNKSDHDGQTVSTGLTLTWNGNVHKHANGSWMGRFAGGNLMPVGLDVDGVFPEGGIIFTSDAGFSVIRDAAKVPNNDATKPNPISFLGLGNGGGYYTQLGYFEEQDNGTWPTYHLGLIESSDINLQYNLDPNCAKCNNYAQIIFGPTNQAKGLAIGTGIGSNLKTAMTMNDDTTLVFTPVATYFNSDTHIENASTLYFGTNTTMNFYQNASESINIKYSDTNKTLQFDNLHGDTTYYFGGTVQAQTGVALEKTPTDSSELATITTNSSGDSKKIITSIPFGAPSIFTSSGGADMSTNTISGQGSWLTWNLNPGDAATYLININPGGPKGGFKLYDLQTNTTVSTQTPLLSLNAYDGAQFSHVVIAPYFSSGSHSSKTLSTIQAETHYESEHIWCHDCRNSGQAAGAGTGRWIYKDSAGNWLSDDGVAAIN